MESMVKVKGPWGESDYIPLCYHPKKLYWDGAGVLAQDFDAVTGAFKQAWMSFRVDDEVAVMLKEGVPVAVVGFADGVPRIGEAAWTVKAANTTVSWNILGNPNNWLTVGPDGLDLGLKLKSEKFFSKTDPEYLTSDPANSYNIVYWTMLAMDNTYLLPYEDQKLMLWPYIVRFTYDYLSFGPMYYEYYYTIIGPLLFRIRTIHGITSTAKNMITDPPPITLALWLPYSEIATYPPGITPGSYPDAYTHSFMDGTSEGDLSGVPVGEAQILGNFPLGPEPTETVISENKGDFSTAFLGIYTKELLAKYKINPDIPDHSPSIGGWPLTAPDPMWEWPFDFYTRPHTKEELEAAGLWPAGTP